MLDILFIVMLIITMLSISWVVFYAKKIDSKNIDISAETTNFKALTKENKSLQSQLKSEEALIDEYKEKLNSQASHMKELNVELHRLSLVASKTDTAVLITDKDGDIEWVNEGFEKLYGYNLEGVRNHLGSNITSISRFDNVKTMLDNALKNHVPLNYTTKIQHKSGTSKWVKTVLNPIFSDDGEVQNFIILDTDVSELKDINSKLKKLSLVASKTNNAVIIFDADHKIDWVNEGFHNMYGFSKEEYIGNFGPSFTAYLTSNAMDHLYDELTTKGESHSFVGKVTDRFGKEKWKQTAITPVYIDKKEKYSFIVIESDITKIKDAERKIQEEKNKGDKLLLNILPEETAEELKSKGKATPRLYRSASVLFADIKDFTKLAEDLTPNELVETLQSYFSKFDEVTVKHIIEKIKTMGDAFLCVGGIPIRNKSHSFDTVLAALELQRIMVDMAKSQEKKGRKALSLRIGIHSGPLVAGVVGVQKMTYDIWGDTVNIAKRIESACVPGMVNVSYSTYENIKDYFECEHRGKILAKHKGHIDMYFVKRIKPEFSVNGEGIVPNNHFVEMMSQL